jgi:hypothetical protein
MSDNQQESYDAYTGGIDRHFGLVNAGWVDDGAGNLQYAVDAQGPFKPRVEIDG